MGYTYTPVYAPTDASAVSMAAANQVTDSPSNDAESVGNYCTLNPLEADSAGTFADGNLKCTFANLKGERGTIGLASGKWYWETTQNANGGEVGWYSATASLATSAGGQSNGVGSWALNFNGRSLDNPVGGSLTTSSDYTQWAFSSGDVVGCAVDIDAGKIWFHIDGTYLQSGSGTSGNVGNPATGANAFLTGLSGTVFPFVGDGTGTAANSQTVNFGQSSFAHSAPSGFKAINTANLSSPTVTDPSAYYQTATWTGDGTAIGSGGKTITFGGNSNLVPDLVWVKRRNEARSHQLYNSVIGWAKANYSDLTDAVGNIPEGVSSVTTDGFVVGNNGGVNESSDTYVAWCPKAGGAPTADNSGSASPTNNSIMIDGSADTSTLTTSDIYPKRASGSNTSKFGIIRYTGNGSSSTQTLANPFNWAPDVIFCKNMEATDDWEIFHSSLGSSGDSRMYLNKSDAASGASRINAVSTTQITFVASTSGCNPSSQDVIMYAWAKTSGAIAAGKYTGNGSADGPVVVVDDGGSGFKPAFVLIKAADRSNNWHIFDSARSPYNQITNDALFPDLDAVEGGTNAVDFLSNGFKLRTSEVWLNASSSNNYIYLAFAETPFALNNRAR